MKGKGNLANILGFIVAMIAGYKGLASEHAQAWFGVAAFAISTVLSTFFTNGVFVSGWKPAMWVITIAGVVIQVLNATATASLVSAEVVTYVILAITTFINVFYKSYDGGISIAEKKLA